jgi:hypothetical protein
MRRRRRRFEQKSALKTLRERSSKPFETNRAQMSLSNQIDNKAQAALMIIRVRSALM